MKRFKKFNKIRLHHEGTHTLVISGLILVIINATCFLTMGKTIPSYLVLVLSIVAYAIMVNFFRCPIRYFNGDTAGIVVAPADGKVVVAEEVLENEYFHDRRLMISIFMSLYNVHANWFPVDGYVTNVKHEDGNFHKAWLPKASLENERSTVTIKTPEGHEVLVRQVAGAVARRIVSYARENEECYIDEHLGFIKFGSRVDIYLPLGSNLMVKLGDKTVGDMTIIAKLPDNNG
ncbi:MAG: phosphatidylserine decarboxylase family protein [Bacteroidaceae bacterium]|nr:phosphatidylserine decarboxylase family protein [Bacteroidaceae bacterium]